MAPLLLAQSALASSPPSAWGHQLLVTARQCTCKQPLLKYFYFCAGKNIIAVAPSQYLSPGPRPDFGATSFVVPNWLKLVIFVLPVYGNVSSFLCHCLQIHTHIKSIIPTTAVVLFSSSACPFKMTSPWPVTLQQHYGQQYFPYPSLLSSFHNNMWISHTK